MPNIRIGSLPPGFSASLFSPVALVESSPGSSLEISGSSDTGLSCSVFLLCSFSSSWAGFDDLEAVLDDVEMVEKCNLLSSPSVTRLYFVNRLHFNQDNQHIHLSRRLDAFIVAILSVVHTRAVVEICLCEGEVALRLSVIKTKVRKT